MRALTSQTTPDHGFSSYQVTAQSGRELLQAGRQERNPLGRVAIYWIESPELLLANRVDIS